jgi:hypothetical protein
LSERRTCFFTSRVGIAVPQGLAAYQALLPATIMSTIPFSATTDGECGHLHTPREMLAF